MVRGNRRRVNSVSVCNSPRGEQGLDKGWTAANGTYCAKKLTKASAAQAPAATVNNSQRGKLSFREREENMLLLRPWPRSIRVAYRWRARNPKPLKTPFRAPKERSEFVI